MPPADIGRPH